MRDADIGFVELRRGDGSVLAVLARETLAVHVLAANYSMTAGGAFVSDDFLSESDGDTSTAALELESEGLWRRGRNGYHIVDSVILAVIRRAHERLRQYLPECYRRGGHTPSPTDPRICAVCGLSLRVDDPTGW